MEKDFDAWNERKKQINNTNNKIEFRECEVRWCTLGTNIGCEEDGKHQLQTRPIVVLKKFNKNACLIVPLTTAMKSNKYYFFLGVINKENSSAILSQIRFIDARRLGSQLGTLNPEVFNELKKLIGSICLDI